MSASLSTGVQGAAFAPEMLEEAYHTLHSTEKRKEYDELGYEGARSMRNESSATN